MVHGLLGVAQHLERLGCAVTGQIQRLHRHVGKGLDERVRNPVLGRGSLLALFAGALGRFGAAVHDGHGHRDQRNAVRNAVVDAYDERAAGLSVVTHKIFDQVHLPQRPPGIERLHGEFAHTVL
ncbi:hypothetical protein D3C71_1298900 [compost metagenome]